MAANEPGETVVAREPQVGATKVHSTPGGRRWPGGRRRPATHGQAFVQQHRIDDQRLKVRTLLWGPN